MKQMQSASRRKIVSKFLGKRFYAGALPQLGRAAIGGFVAASLVLFGALYVGFISHSPDKSNAIAPHQGRLAAAAPAPNRTPRLIDAAFAMPPSSSKKGGSAALIAKGKQLFQAHTCSSCHGSHAQGTAIAPPLAGIGHYFNEKTFSSLIHHPNSQMTAKGMPPAPLSDKQTHALWTYLNSMPVPAHRGPGVPAVVKFKKTSAKPIKSTIPSHAIAKVRSQHRTTAATV